MRNFYEKPVRYRPIYSVQIQCMKMTYLILLTTRVCTCLQIQVEVLVPDNADRGHFFSQAREQQLSMGLRDVGRRVPYDGKRRWDGRPANGRGRMRYIIELEWKHGMMHGLGRFTFANGSMRPIQAPPN